MKSKSGYFRIVSGLMLCLVLVFATNLLAQTSEQKFLNGIKGLAIKPNGKPLKVGIAFAEFSTEFAISLAAYPKWLLEQAGAEVTMVNSDYNLKAQQDTLDDYVAMGADVIIIQPVDDFAIAAKVREIQAKGIPVMALNHPAMDSNKIPINEAGGVSPNKEMAAECTNFIVGKAAGKQVKVAEILGDIKQIIAQQRDATFREILAKNPNIKLVNTRVTDWGPDGAMQATEDFITADPDLFAIYAQSDGMLQGVFAALKRNGKLFPVGDPKHIYIVSVDGAPYAHQAIREKLSDLSMEQSPYAMASVVVKAALMHGKGIKLPPAPKAVIEVAPEKINAQTVNADYLWGNFGKPHDKLWPNTLKIWEKYRFPGDEAIINKVK